MPPGRISRTCSRTTNIRELLTRSILISAFALWGIVQLIPGLPASGVINDVVIVLFVVDLAFIVSPWT